MRRFILTLLVGTLLAVSSGCRVLPDVFPCYRPFNSIADCWRANVRRPTDWCWGNCPVTQPTDDCLLVEGVETADGS